MKILNVRRTYRNLLRIKEILQVLTKHGFGHIVSRLNLTIYIPGLRNLGVPSYFSPNLSEESAAARFRMVLQELGPTFVKLGQILSGRPDILPENFIQELRLLQDHVPPFATSIVRETIEQELGAPITEIFPHFDGQALASGSIGQVHSARLPNGTAVIVKVKRPGIGKIIDTDVAILRFLAELAEKYIEELKIFQLVMIVDEFAKTVRRELDFTSEAAYTEKFYVLLQENPAVTSPLIFWEYTTANLITLQKLQGTNIGEIELLKEQGIDLKKLADNLTYSFTQQYFVWGIFHGDPHPGNVLVAADGKICLVDFGMVGHLSDELKSQLATTLLALLKNNLDMIVEVYADIGVFPKQLNRRELKTDILELLDKYFNTPFQHLDIAKIFEDIVRLARNHKVILPRDFILLGKSLVTITGLARELDPDFKFAKAISPHISTILREKFSPRKLFDAAIFPTWTFFSLLQRLPSNIKDLLRLVKNGDLQLVLQHEIPEKAYQQLDKVSNRIAVSIVVSAIIISSSLLILANIEPKLHGIPLLGIIGYMFAGIIGLWFLIGIFRSGRL